MNARVLELIKNPELFQKEMMSTMMWKILKLKKQNQIRSHFKTTSGN